MDFWKKLPTEIKCDSDEVERIATLMHHEGGNYLRKIKNKKLYKEEQNFLTLLPEQQEAYRCAARAVIVDQYNKYIKACPELHNLFNYK